MYILNSKKAHANIHITYYGDMKSGRVIHAASDMKSLRRLRACLISKHGTTNANEQNDGIVYCFPHSTACALKAET